MTPVLVTALITIATTVATYGLLTLVRFPRAEGAAESDELLDTPAASAPLVGGVLALSALAIAGVALDLLARGIERQTFIVRWDGTDATFRDVASGVYIADIRIARYISTMKLHLMR